MLNTPPHPQICSWPLITHLEWQEPSQSCQAHLSEPTQPTVGGHTQARTFPYVPKPCGLKVSVVRFSFLTKKSTILSLLCIVWFLRGRGSVGDAVKHLKLAPCARTAHHSLVQTLTLCTAGTELQSHSTGISGQKVLAGSAQWPALWGGHNGLGPILASAIDFPLQAGFKQGPCLALVSGHFRTV